jgi:nicotinamidase-related amidase
MIDLQGRNSALLVIDPQVEATAEGEGTLPAIGSTTAVERIVELLDATRRARVPIIFTQEVHRKELVDFGRELDGAEPIHCVEGTPGVELRPEAKPLEGEWLIQKRRYSAFFATDLDLLLRGIGVDTLIVCGFLTNVCVHYSCVDAHQRDYHLYLARDATAGSSLAASEAALAAIEYLQRDSVQTTRELVSAIESLSADREAVLAD